MSKILNQINQIELRYTRPHISKLPEILFPFTATNILRSVIDEEGILDIKTYHWVFLLTADNRLLGISQINSDAILSTNLYMREVMQLALLSNAVGIILIRNNPSGSLVPTEGDIECAKKMKEIGSLMNIHLRYSVIITSEGYTSIPLE